MRGLTEFELEKERVQKMGNELDLMMELYQIFEKNQGIMQVLNTQLSELDFLSKNI